jgi:hypothetical protein
VNNEDWVLPRSGGVSLRSQPAGLSGPWYRLPGNTEYDDAVLLLTNRRGHWLFQATRLIRLADYRAALGDLNKEFIRV